MRPLAIAAALLCLLPGCIIVDAGDARSNTSRLIVEWSIDGVRDPDQCDQGNVDAVHVDLLDRSGVVLAAYEQNCTAFATAIELHPGEYAADIVMLDPAGFERTTPVRVRPFTLYDADQLEIPVDFPASSFY